MTKYVYKAYGATYSGVAWTWEGEVDAADKQAAMAAVTVMSQNWLYKKLRSIMIFEYEKDAVVGKWPCLVSYNPTEQGAKIIIPVQKGTPQKLDTTPDVYKVAEWLIPTERPPTFTVIQLKETHP